MEQLGLNEREYDLVQRMVQESGEMWRESRDRTKADSEVVICISPSRAFYLSWAGNVEGNINGWLVEVKPLSMDHAREFFAAFGSHWYYWLGVGMQNNIFTMRAYIKNGRKPDWTISIERIGVSNELAEVAQAVERHGRNYMAMLASEREGDSKPCE